MQRKGLMIAGVLILICGVVSSGLAGTRDDCVAKCKEAGAFIHSRGIKAAIQEIGSKNGKFVWKEGVSYVFLMDMNARMLAHPHSPELTSANNLLEVTDVNGKPFFMDFIKTAQKGKGWTKYAWKVPGMEIIKPKHTFIYRVPDTDYFVGAGFYVMSPGEYY